MELSNVSEEMKKYLNKKGTTTVGVVCKEGVVFASDKRAVAGFFVAHKEMKKIHKIDEHLGTTVAGAVSDAQSMMRVMKAEAQLYKMRQEAAMPVEAAATLLANILHGARYYPYLLQALVGGIGDAGASIFSIDPLGAVAKEKMVATGSGSPTAYGVLEDNFKEDMEIDAGIDLALRAMRAALERDAMSGDGIDLVTITKEGFKRLTKEEIDAQLKKIKGKTA